MVLSELCLLYRWYWYSTGAAFQVRSIKYCALAVRLLFVRYFWKYTRLGLGMQNAYDQKQGRKSLENWKILNWFEFLFSRKTIPQNARRSCINALCALYAALYSVLCVPNIRHTPNAKAVVAALCGGMEGREKGKRKAAHGGAALCLTYSFSKALRKVQKGTKSNTATKTIISPPFLCLRS